MNASTGRIRAVGVLVTAVVAAVLAAPLAAGSVGRPPDVQDAAQAAQPPMPDVIERYAAAHPFGIGLGWNAPDVGRPPDVQDAAQVARFLPVVTPSGFHWADYGAGIGTGVGSAVLMVAVAVASATRRRRARTA